jgi:hypothetical protein
MAKKHPMFQIAAGSRDPFCHIRRFCESTHLNEVHQPHYFASFHSINVSFKARGGIDILCECRKLHQYLRKLRLVASFSDVNCVVDLEATVRRNWLSIQYSVGPVNSRFIRVCDWNYPGSVTGMVTPSQPHATLPPILFLVGKTQSATTMDDDSDNAE